MAAVLHVHQIVHNVMAGEYISVIDLNIGRYLFDTPLLALTLFSDQMGEENSWTIYCCNQ